MSELDQAYRALAHEADTVQLAAPGALRARADRRTRLRVTAVAVAAAVAVGSAVFGTQWVVRADGTAPPPIPPGATQSPTPPAPTSAPPTSAPPSSPPATSTPPATTRQTTPPPPSRPKSIPNSAFLQAADLSRGYVDGDAPSENVMPSLCDATFASDRGIDLRRSRRLTYFNAGTPEASTPDGTIMQTITVYEPGDASRFVDEVRDAVAGCPSEGDDRYRMVSAPKRGDESLMFEKRYPTKDPDGNPIGGEDVRLVSVVRIGDVVTILYETGWEAGWSAEPDLMNSFTAKAASRLRSWLD